MCIKENIYHELRGPENPKNKAIGTLIITTISALLQLESSLPFPEKLTDYIKYLPEGLKIWAYYLMSHTSHINKDYNESLGIVETSLSMSEEIFPVPMIYMHISAAMSMMGLKKIDEAKKHFYAAWDLAQPDGLIEPFGENHGLLFGLIETCLKDRFTDEYDKIIAITYNFSKSWRRVHNFVMKREVTDNLTTMEFSISMLANRGWSNQEIADYMSMSLHTVKRYISIIYQKLNITSRSQLKRYMLQ